MMLPTVKINQKDHGYTEVFVNDKRIERVSSIRFEQDTTTVPTFYIDVVGVPDIEIGGAVVLNATPTDIASASKLILNSYVVDEDFKNATIACVERALVESSGKSIEDRAKFIADRFFGLD